MPRPRRDSEILPAKERLENAFWTLLADRPFGKITVTDVVREARVNRNSFYYHFSGLPELADSAIMVEIERLPLPPVPDSHDDPLVVWHTFCSSMVASLSALRLSLAKYAFTMDAWRLSVSQTAHALGAAIRMIMTANKFFFFIISSSIQTYPLREHCRCRSLNGSCLSARGLYRRSGFSPCPEVLSNAAQSYKKSSKPHRFRGFKGMIK